MRFRLGLSPIITITFLGIMLISCDASVEQDSTATSDAAEEKVKEPSNSEISSEFILVNDTDRPMTEFYLAAPGIQEWNENLNLLPGEIYLEPRSEIRLTIEESRSDCTYNIKSIFGPSADGLIGEGELEQTNVEICDGARYTYSQGG